MVGSAPEAPAATCQPWPVPACPLHLAHFAELPHLPVTVTLPGCPLWLTPAVAIVIAHTDICF